MKALDRRGSQLRACRLGYDHQLGELSFEGPRPVRHCCLGHFKLLTFQGDITLSLKCGFGVGHGILDLSTSQLSLELCEVEVGFPLGPPDGTGKVLAVFTCPQAHLPLLVGPSLGSVGECTCKLVPGSYVLGERMHDPSGPHVKWHGGGLGHSGGQFQRCGRQDHRSPEASAGGCHRSVQLLESHLDPLSSQNRGESRN